MIAGYRAIVLCLLIVALPLTAERKPLTSPTLRVIKHEATGTRLRIDANGQQLEYPVQGLIEHDPASGNFLLSWNGRDQKRKRLVFQPANKIEAVVAAAVEFDDKTKLYRYNYSVSSMRSSQQKLQMFFLESGVPIQEAVAPSSSWYGDRFTDFLQRQFKAKHGWTWANVNENELGVPQGQRSGPFSLRSSAPPGIVKCYVRGYVPPLRSDEDLPEELHAAIDRVAWSLPQGVTVGPVQPYPESPAEAVSDLLATAHAAEEQGWFLSPNLATTTRASLKTLETHIRKGRLSSAKLAVQLLITELEANRTSLLPEAQSVLLFRLSALRERLAKQI